MGDTQNHNVPISDAVNDDIAVGREASPTWPEVAIPCTPGIGIFREEQKPGGKGFDDAGCGVEATALGGDVVGNFVQIRLGAPGEAVCRQRLAFRSASRRARQRSMTSLLSRRMDSG